MNYWKVMVTKWLMAIIKISTSQEMREQAGRSIGEKIELNGLREHFNNGSQNDKNGLKLDHFRGFVAIAFLRSKITTLQFWRMGGIRNRCNNSPPIKFRPLRQAYSTYNVSALDRHLISLTAIAENSNREREEVRIPWRHFVTSLGGNDGFLPHEWRNLATSIRITTLSEFR